MKMTILERDDNITLVALTGRLDTSGVEEISESFSDALKSANQSTIIDLSQIDFLGSQGLGLLIGNGKWLKKSGHKMLLLHPTELVESVIRTTRLDRVLPILHDLDEAIREVGGVSAAAATDHPTDETPDHEPADEPSQVSTAPPFRVGELKLSIQNELAELKGLNASVATFLREHGVPDKAIYAVHLAIEELVGNVIRYAYVDDEPHFIDIELAIEAEQVILRSADDGRPFDPRKGPSLDLHSEERGVADLGLLLVLEMVDLLKYRRVDESNLVEVRVHLFVEVGNGEPDKNSGEQ